MECWSKDSRYCWIAASSVYTHNHLRTSCTPLCALDPWVLQIGGQGIRVSWHELAVKSMACLSFKSFHSWRRELQQLCRQPSLMSCTPGRERLKNHMKTRGVTNVFRTHYMFFFFFLLLFVAFPLPVCCSFYVYFPVCFL